MCKISIFRPKIQLEENPYQAVDLNFNAKIDYFRREKVQKIRIFALKTGQKLKFSMLKMQF